MAERRMFAKSIVMSDAFLDMPLSARCLYFTLGMLADDDGFVSNPKSIIRQCGASEDDLKVLIGKKFVLWFETGVIVIKHWRMNNYLRNDRHNKTTYIEEMQFLGIDEKGAYTTNPEKMVDGIPHDNHLTAGGIPHGNHLETQDSIGKDSIGKDRIDKDKPVRHKYGEYKNVLLTDEQYEKLKNEFPNDYEKRIEEVSIYCQSHGKKYKDYLATIRNWARKEKPKESGWDNVKV